MKRFLFLLVLLVAFLALANPAHAELIDNITSYWKFDDNATSSTAIDSAGDVNGTINSATYTSASKLGPFALDVGGTGDTEYVQVNGAVDHISSTTTPTTLNFWVNSTADGSYQRIFNGGTGDTDYVLQKRGDNNRLRVLVRTSGTIRVDANSNTSIPTNQYTMLTAVNNGTDYNLYINGDAVGSGSITSAAWSSGVARIGSRDDGNEPFAGVIDEPSIWERALNSTEVQELYNEGDGNQYPFEDEVAQITLLSPDNDTLLNTETVDFEFNVTHDSSTLGNDSFTVELWTNKTGTWNLTNSTDSYTNASLGQLSANFSEGNYLWGIRVPEVLCVPDPCIEETFSENRTFEVDLTEPEINTSGTVFDGDFFAVGGQLLGPNNITGEVNVSDDNLLTVNISTTDEAGNLVDNLFFDDNVTSGSVEETVNHNVSGYDPGTYNLTVYAADGHTARKIPEWSVKKTRGVGLRFEEETRWIGKKDYVEVRLQGTTFMKGLSAEKRKDRYVFNYEDNNLLASPKKELTFVVESDHPIRILGDRMGYQGHLVIPEITKWVDFELENASGKEEYTIERVNEHQVLVTVSNLPERRTHTFKSVGELNTNTVSVEFGVVNGTVTFDEDVQEDSETDITLSLFADSDYTTDANLSYNGSIIEAAKTTNSTHQTYTATATTPIVSSGSTEENVTFFWNYDIQQGSVQEINTTDNFTQTSQGWFIDSCQNFTTVARNYTFYDEGNGTQLDNVDVELVIDYEANGIEKNHSAEFEGVENVSLCISPSDASFTGDLTIQYRPVTVNDTYLLREYYEIDETYNSTTVERKLYSLLAEDASTVIIRVLNRQDDALAGILVEAHRYNIAKNSYIKVESDKTDPDGEVALGLVAADVFYKFKIFEGTELRLETETFKIIQNEYEYKIGPAIQDGPLLDVYRLNQIDANVTVDFDTREFTYVYDDELEIGSQYCLKIVNGTQDVINQTCSTQSANVLTLTPNEANGTLIGQGTVLYNNQLYILDTATLSAGEFKDHFSGAELAGFALLVVMVIMLVAANSPKLLVAGGVAGVIATYFLDLLPIGLVGVFSIVFLGALVITLMRERRGV